MEWSMALAVVLLLFLVLLHLTFPRKYNWPRVEWEMFKIPGPVRVPYFGSVILITAKVETFLDFLVKLHDRYKPLYKIDVVGQFHVMISDVDDVKIILNSMDHITKSDDYRNFLPWFGTGLLNSTGQKWHNHRKWLTPAFHFKILDKYFDAMNKNANILVGELTKHVKDDYVNINKMMSLCTLDIICETAMGVTVDAQKGKGKEYVEAIIRMSRVPRLRLLFPWLSPDWMFYLCPTGRKQKEILTILHGYTERVISERKATYRQKRATPGQSDELGQKVKKSFLDLLIELSETQNKMTEEEMREEVDTFMFEGHDTTSAGICWALYLLGSHPEIQERAYEELQEIFEGSNRDPTRADLAKMKYLERIIKETLRLYPSVPLIARKLEVDVKIRNYVIPAGTNIQIHVYCIHRDPKHFPDPLKFDPDRFLSEAVLGRHPYAYIPFSAGPRNCIGQRFATMEEKVILSQILRKFQVTSLDPPENIQILAELILRPKDGLRLAFKQRPTLR